MFAATAPLLLITMLLTTYLVRARQGDSRAQFLEANRISTAYLGDGAVLELYSSDRVRLQEIANKTDRVSHLIGVAYLNGDRQLIASTDNFTIPNNLFDQSPPLGQLETRDILYLQQPIYTSSVAVDDYQEESPYAIPTEQLVGWVITAFDSSGNISQRRSIVLTGIGIGIGGLALSILLSLYLGRSIVRPVRQLTHTVGRMESGDLNVRADPTTIEELTLLAQGINQLAASVAEGRRNLEDKVHRATWRLEETLENLRDKNRELEQARATAEAANQAKSEFLARMSHELRTPITAIQGFTRLLQRTELGDAERNYCTIINQSSLQLLNLIDDILAISRLQSNTIELETTPFNLIETLEQAVGQVALSAREKQLELILDIAPEVPTTVVGDGFRVAQIVTNLVSNAVKFTDHGHVRTTVSAVQHDDQYTDIQLLVSDTGIGIPEHKRENLFQAFAQADTSITRKYGGTGLGLSIVKSLVDLMKGSVCLESSEGEGTTFKVTLPVPVTAVEKGLAPLDARVVLVDEHNLSQQAVADTLCRFVAELDVREQIEELDDLNPDAVVLSLPSRANDKDNLDRIKHLQECCTAPLLVLTPASVLSARFYPGLNTDNHVVRFLDKPATQLSLHHALQQLIHGRPALISAQGNRRLLGELCILIAEDNPFTREFLKTLLSREGAYCVTVSTGIEALAACDTQHFDIMLIDIHMPGKSGIETVNDIRNSDKENRSAPIIAITADVLQQEEEALAKVGINDLLFKPFNEQQLLERILHFCRPQVTVPQLQNKLGDDIQVEQFLAEVNRLVAAIANACRNHDLESARDPAHQLLGITGVFKLPELEVHVSNLHRAIKNHRHSQAQAALEELKKEVERLAAMDSYVE